MRGVSNNPIYSLFATPASFAPLFLRLSLVVIFFYHGAQKAFGWFGGEGWNATLQAWGAAEGANLSPVATASLIIAELVIPVFLMFGFLTRPTALFVVVLMIGELFYVAGEGGFLVLELPIMLLTAGLSLLFIGGGRLSIDRGISLNLLPTVG